MCLFVFTGNRKRCSRKTPNKHAEEWIKREEDPPGFAVRFFENKGKHMKYTSSLQWNRVEFSLN
jgi:hypothetical protein